MKLTLLLAISLAISISVKAADVIAVGALTDQIIVVQFDDGYVQYHTLGQPQDADVAIVNPLDVTLADLTSTYSIASLADPAFGGGVPPVMINRKSKPTEFTRLCQTGTATSCVNIDPDHAKEHFLYLHLSSPMISGVAYQINFPGLTGISSEVFTYDEQATRSEAVHVNQLGYVPDAGEKFGYVYHWMGDGGGLDLSSYAGNSFHLIKESDGSIAFSGTMQFRKPEANQEIAYITEAPPYGNLIGVESYECDFSSFSTVGSYRLCVEDIGCSFPFEIKADVHKEPMLAILNGLYQQRSGIATTAPYTDQPRPAPHNPQLTPGFSDKLFYTTFRYPDFSDADGSSLDKAAIEAGILGNLDAWGWYQDAGDWDGYFLHTSVAMKLLWLFEMGADVFTDNELNIPESGNGIPDLLDEAMWLPRFYQRLRSEMNSKSYGTGGVGGARIFGDLWGGGILDDGTTIGSWQDTSRIWVVTGEDPFISYKYAGMAAHIAFLLNSNGLSDPDGIDWTQEAIQSYSWAQSNTLPQDTFLTDIPMTYIRSYASANLYRLTGDPAYQGNLLADLSTLDPSVSLRDDLLFALATYIETKGVQPTNASIVKRAGQKIKGEADFTMKAFRDDRACRWGGNFYFPFLSGHPTTPYVTSGIIAHYLTRDDFPAIADTYLPGLYSTADYFLGNNPLNMCWITGLGDRSPKQLLNIDSWYLGTATSTRKGIVPYGPWRTDPPFFDYLGPFNHLWAFEFTYPSSPDDWPAHERYFDQRYAPPTNEYTVHQTLANSIFTYGYLYANKMSAAPLVAGKAEIEDTASELEIYPNPSNGTAHLTLPQGTAQIAIYDLPGQLIELRPTVNSPEVISGLESGAYLLCAIQEEGERVCKKLIVRNGN